jgi:hypothetical protein
LASRITPRRSNFAPNSGGLSVATKEDGIAYLASPVDPEAYVLRLRHVSAKRLDLIALVAGSRGNVDALAAKLASAGIKIDRAPQELTTPGGGYGFRFFDCDGRLS